MDEIIEFNETLWEYYGAHGRHDLPWRQIDADGHCDPYNVVVSELMLQQTQVGRVIPKFHEFLMKFPDVRQLAAASLAEVLVVWSGLGYNRRAKFLWQTAQKVVADYDGVFPKSIPELVSLPGVGKNTAGAIMAYAFNEPAVFIETNVRTVYIHHFFKDQFEVPDSAITEVLTKTIDTKNPREFYWALMDYGTHLKQTVGNLNRLSRGYTKQSPFQGSKRQIRGQVLKLLAENNLSAAQLAEHINDARLSEVLQTLVTENLIKKTDMKFHL